MRPPGSSRRRVLAALVTVSALLGSCSVSTNDEPVAAGDLFKDLLVSTTTSTSAPEGVTKLARIFFLQTDAGATRLVPVQREVDIDAQVQQVLDNLFTVPPDPSDPDEVGLTSAISSTATFRSATILPNSTQLVVDVTGLPQGSGLRNALAQIVWTATESPLVQSVSFRTEGAPVDAIIGDGTSVARAVNRSDYTTLSGTG